jgi:hypothetical protein
MLMAMVRATIAQNLCAIYFESLMIIKMRGAAFIRRYGTITQEMLQANCLQMKQP